jgi:hypothetical protein
MLKLKYNYIYLFLGIAILIIITSIFIMINNNKKNFNCKFLSKEETKLFINNDIDNYIKNLSIYDIKARKVNSNEEYKKKVINSCLDFTLEQIEKLKKCSLEAEKFFNNNNIWTFALIDNNYEEGFPHTRTNIIFLSPNVINYEEIELIKTLIHESIHIYQRYNKKEIKEYLKNNGYSFSRYKPLVSLIRANPDLDNIIYKDRNGIELVAYYNSDNPTGINDITLKNYMYEHPFEKMAYEIAEIYYKSVISKYKDII